MKFTTSALVVLGFVLPALAGVDGDVCITTCQKEDNVCRTAPEANQSTCESNLRGCIAKCPQNTCMDKCKEAEDKCRTMPGANQSTCSAEYAECCSNCNGGDMTTTAKPEPTPEPAPPGCLDQCERESDQCKNTPNANLSTCASELEYCKSCCYGGGNSTTTHVNPVPPTTHIIPVPPTTVGPEPTIITAGAANIYPALGLIPVMGFAALLQ